MSKDIMSSIDNKNKIKSFDICEYGNDDDDDDGNLGNKNKRI